jgi:peroxiredoxin
LEEELKKMTRFLTAAAFACMLAFTPLAAQAEIAIGKAAPDFTGADTSGTLHRLADYKGRIVVLEWTNPGCPYVHKYYDGGAMQALQKQASAEDVVWLTIDSSAAGKDGYLDEDAGKAYILKTNMASSALLIDADGAIGKLYEAKSTPHMFVIDKEGTLVYRGAIDDRPAADAKSLDGATNYVRAALDELQAGKPVTTAVTQAYGCNIKYEN